MHSCDGSSLAIQWRWRYSRPAGGRSDSYRQSGAWRARRVEPEGGYRGSRVWLTARQRWHLRFRWRSTLGEPAVLRRSAATRSKRGVQAARQAAGAGGCVWRSRTGTRAPRIEPCPAAWDSPPHHGWTGQRCTRSAAPRRPGLTAAARSSGSAWGARAAARQARGRGGEHEVCASAVKRTCHIHNRQTRPTPTHANLTYRVGRRQADMHTHPSASLRLTLSPPRSRSFKGLTCQSDRISFDSGVFMGSSRVGPTGCPTLS
jgi:hypothetical protein